MSQIGLFATDSFASSLMLRFLQILAFMASIDELCIYSIMKTEKMSIRILSAECSNGRGGRDSTSIFDWQYLDFLFSSTLTFCLAIPYYAPFSVTTYFTADTRGGQGLAIRVLKLVIVIPHSGESGDWAHNLYPPPRHEAILKELSLRLLCHIENISGSRIYCRITRGSKYHIPTSITVGNAIVEVEDCVIYIFAQEVFDDTFSPTIEAAIHLSKVVERYDEMVQIDVKFDFAKDALVQVALRLMGDLFEREGALSTASRGFDKRMH
ncbi:hypothetical protein Tco_0891617, partial [Tanacetum coccineum]